MGEDLSRVREKIPLLVMQPMNSNLLFRTISGNPRQFNYRDESSGVCISAQSK